jgi:hypothetical protein
MITSSSRPSRGASRSRVARGVQAAALTATTVGGGIAASSPPAAAQANCNAQVEEIEWWFFNCYVGYGYDTSGGYVNAVQNVLQATLYYTGCVDTQYGPITAGAIQDYRYAHGITGGASNVVNDETWADLNSEIVYRYTNPAGERFHSFGPWDTSWRHHSRPNDYQYTASGTCAPGDASWVKMAV